MDDGRTKEEWKMEVETRKILSPDIEVNAMCTRVPVFVSHAEWCNVEFNNPFELDNIYSDLEEAKDILVHDRRQDGGYMTPRDATRHSAVYISRIHRDVSRDNGLNMWIVADNVYGRGAALNAVQIAELLINANFYKD